MILPEAMPEQIWTLWNVTHQQTINKLENLITVEHTDNCVDFDIICQIHLPKLLYSF